MTHPRLGVTYLDANADDLGFNPDHWYIKFNGRHPDNVVIADSLEGWVMIIGEWNEELDEWNEHKVYGEVEIGQPAYTGQLYTVRPDGSMVKSEYEY